MCSSKWRGAITKHSAFATVPQILLLNRETYRCNTIPWSSSFRWAIMPVRCNPHNSAPIHKNEVPHEKNSM